jgi:hypothetical protein
MKKTLLASIAVAGMAASAMATGFNGTPNSGDVFLGFQNGGTTAYVLDLGSAANFKLGQNLDFGTLQGFSSSDVAADLTHVMGSANWYSSGTTYMGLIGGNLANGVIVGNGNSTTPITSPAASSIGQTYSNISAIADNNQTGQSAWTPAAGGGNYVGWESLNSDTEAWNKYHGGAGFVANSSANGNGGNISYTIFSGDLQSIVGSGLEVDSFSYNVGTGISTSAYLGTLSVSSAGAVTFSAVPEPGTYALFGLGALLLIVAYRRQTNSTI